MENNTIPSGLASSIIGKQLRSLSLAQRRALRPLTLPPDSYMQAMLEQPPTTAMCWQALQGATIHGWCLVCWFTPAVRSYLLAYINVFVAAAARRQNIGFRLIQHALLYCQQNAMIPQVYATSAAQHRFYESCQIMPAMISATPLPGTFWANHRFVLHAIKTRRLPLFSD